MIYKSIIIDMWQDYRTTLKIPQYESSGRTINISLTSNGAAVDLTSATVVFYMSKTSGLIYNGCTVTDATAGKITLVITSGICDTAGSFDCFIDISITDDYSKTLKFTTEIEESDDPSEAVEAQSEFTALTDALAAVANIVTHDGTSTAGNFPKYTDASGSEVEDSGVSAADVALGAASSVAGNVPIFSDTGGKQFADSSFNFGAWESWTPTPAGITVGNGTLIAQYKKIGKYVPFELSFELGSTSAITGAVSFPLPSSTSGIANRVSQGSLFDTSTSKRLMAIGIIATDTLYLRVAITSGGFIEQQNLSSTNPFTWAEGDILSISGYYVES